MTTFIFGDGIAGLIAGFLLKDSIIFGSDKPGGQMNSSMPLGPRILEVTEQTSFVMGSLGFNDAPKVFKSLYLKNGKAIKKLSQKEEEEYTLKTRGIRKSISKVGNRGRSEVAGWPIDETLISALVQAVEKRIIKKRIIRVQPDFQTFNTETETNISYNDARVISTLPLPVLELLANDEHPYKLEYLPKSFVYVEDLSWVTHAKTVYDFVYILDKDNPVHRATKVKNGVILEANIPLSDLQKLYPKTEGRELKIGQIVHDLAIGDYFGIKLLGRYAEWDHRVRTKEVIHSVMNWV